MHCLDSFNSFHWPTSRSELLPHVVTPKEQHLERKHTRMYCSSHLGGMQWGRCCLDWHRRNEFHVFRVLLRLTSAFALRRFHVKKSGDKHARRFTVAHESFQPWCLSIASRLRPQVTSEDPVLDPQVYGTSESGVSPPQPPALFWLCPHVRGYF